MLYTTNYSLFLRSWRNNKIINKQCYVDKVTPESKGWPLLCTLLYNVSHHPLTAEFLSYLMQKQQISHSNKCFIWSSSWTSFKHTDLCFLVSRTTKYRHGASWILSPQNLNKQVPCDHFCEAACGWWGLHTLLVSCYIRHHFPSSPLCMLVQLCFIHRNGTYQRFSSKWRARQSTPDPTNKI